MKLKLHHSLGLAHRVLKLIDLPAGMDLTVRGYENGRESGPSVWVYGPGEQSATVCWAEQRNSDSIIVYVGELGEEFDCNTNIPTDRAYRAATGFQHYEPKRAAEFIRTALVRLRRSQTKKGT